MSPLKQIRQFIENREHPSLGLLLILMNFTGLWHPDLKSLKSRLKLLLFYIVIAFFSSQYIKCVISFNPDSLKLILQYTPFHLGILKCCLFQKNYKSWTELVHFISSVERKQAVEKDSEQSKITQEYLGRSRRVTLFFFMLAFVSNIFIFSEPYQKKQVSVNETIYLNIFDSYTPFSKEPPGYYYSMVIQTVFGYMMSMHVVCWDMITVTIMIYFVGQLRMSCLYCSRMIDVQSSENSMRNIVECHKFHTDLVLYQKKFNELISPVMFFYLIIISVNLGVCIIQIAELENDLPTLVSSCMYIVACLIQLLLFYWHSNEVTVESERVSYSTFKSDWTAMDYRMQRKVALLAWTTSKRLAFRAGPFNEMSLSTFISILRSSYSFYTLLKGTN